MHLISFKPSQEMTFKTTPGDLKRFTRYLETRASDQSQEVSIDLSHVSRCDSAGLAFLIEANKQILQRKKDCHFLGMPSMMEALIAFWGIKQVLQSTYRISNISPRMPQGEQRE